MTHPTPPSHHLLAADVDGTERLSADDQATLREQQFQASALQRQQRAAALAAQRQRQGTCAYCAAACLPLAVYCDDDCKADHERMLSIRRRQGLAR